MPVLSVPHPSSSPYSSHPRCQHPPNWLDMLWWAPDLTTPTLSCMACRSPWPLSFSANKHVGPRRFANESFEQCRTTAQWTSLASSGIEDPVQNSYSHTQNSQHRHTILFVLSAEPLQTNSTASFVQLKSPGTPPSKTKFGSLAFHTAAPLIWNGLPADIRSSPSFQTFKKMLKTHYFRSPPT